MSEQAIPSPRLQFTGLPTVGNWTTPLVLMVIISLGAWLVHELHAARLTQLRSQGSNLARMLSRVPAGELLAANGHSPTLDLLRHLQGNPDFAYGLVVAPDGRRLAGAERDGVVVPVAPISDRPSDWFEERSLDASTDGTRYREFTAPLLESGDLVGMIRVGYREPGLLDCVAALSPVSSMVLPVFLLAPLVYLMLRRELRPMRLANERLREAVQAQLARPDETPPLNLQLSGEGGALLSNLNTLLGELHARLQQADEARISMDARGKALMFKNARMEGVLQSLPDGLLVLDRAGEPVFANDQFARLLHVEPDRVRTQRPVSWCRESELGSLLAACDLTRQQRVMGMVEFSPDERPDRRLTATAHPLFASRDDVEPAGTLLTLVDTTRENFARQARKDLIAQLAHELKTPLHVIGMYGEMLLEDEGDDQGFRLEAANLINDQVERISALINNMLSLARLESGNLRLNRSRLRIEDLLEDIRASLSGAAEEQSLEIGLEVPQQLPYISVDKELLRVAVNNLATNAIKYNKPGGRVTIGARESDEAIVLFVADTGLGIPSDKHEAVFEKFLRLEDDPGVQAKGHGLGLSLAKEIVELHLGRIELDSVPGQGSEFRIRLPKTPLLMKIGV
ncbi:MAG: PAS domain-containing protein [Gammaproteobacteria bacterium]|nr:PAS domain-containing protein [Gammaproteobacteria bacterium]